MITNEEARKAVETLKEYSEQQLYCSSCVFRNNAVESDFCDRYFKACICDWSLKVLNTNKIHLKDGKEKSR